MEILDYNPHLNDTLFLEGYPFCYSSLGRMIKEFNLNKDNLHCFIIRVSMGGGMGEPFVDIENSEIKQIEFGDAPEYRRVIRGLNFLGKCSNKKCRIKGKVFYIKIGKGSLDYFRLKNDGKFVCPICDYPVTPKSCGFWDCKFKIKGEGRKVSEIKVKSFSREGVAGTERFSLFDYNSQFEDKVIYIDLNFVVS